MSFLNGVLPWWGWLSVGWFIGFIALMVYALKTAIPVQEREIELDDPRFIAWQETEDDLALEQIVHRPVRGTVLSRGGFPHAH